MNSYHHITDRNEFIEKFRQDQGLPTMSRNETSKTFNRSRIISEPSVKDFSEGRWDYLYSLEKLKQSKLNEKRRSMINNILQQEKKECTFKPTLNRAKSQKKIPNNIVNYNINGISKFISDKNQNKAKLTGGLIQRQQQWNLKRNINIENLKNQQNLNETQECIFKPTLVFFKIKIRIHLIF